MSRLPISFNQSFAPERRYIGSIVEFAARGCSGTCRDISNATGIPTGESSGKVSAMLGYCRGMGLLVPDGLAGENKQPRLSAFGEAVWQEDRHLSEVLTQWVCHLNLCRPDCGGEVWYQLFGEGRGTLGMSFSESVAEEFLQNKVGRRARSPLGPLRTMYSEPACFPIQAITWRDSGQILREPPPLKGDYTLAFGAWLCDLFESMFPGRDQVTLDEMLRVTMWQQIAGWTDSESERLLRELQHRSIVEVDRQMTPWVIHPQVEGKYLYPKIYSDLA